MFPQKRYFWREATQICFAVCWCWTGSTGHGWGLQRGMYTTLITEKTEKGCQNKQNGVGLTRVDKGGPFSV